MKFLMILVVALSVCSAQRRQFQSNQYQDSQPAESAAQEYQAPEQQFQVNDARSRSREVTTPIPIIRYDKEQGNDGSYKAAWETGNNILAQEEGFLKELGPDPDEEGAVLNAQVQQGSYSYTAPDGQIITVNYIADEKGFHPSGDHLPTPPPVSPEVQKGLDLIYAGIRAQQHYKKGDEPSKQKENIFRGKIKAGDSKTATVEFRKQTNIPKPKLPISQEAENPGVIAKDSTNEFKQNGVRTVVKVSKKDDNKDSKTILINYNGNNQKQLQHKVPDERKEGKVVSLNIIKDESRITDSARQYTNNVQVQKETSGKAKENSESRRQREPQIYFHSTYNSVNKTGGFNHSVPQGPAIINQQHSIAVEKENIDNNGFSLESSLSQSNKNQFNDVKTSSNSKQAVKTNTNNLSVNLNQFATKNNENSLLFGVSSQNNLNTNTQDPTHITPSSLASNTLNQLNVNLDRTLFSENQGSHAIIGTLSNTGSSFNNNQNNFATTNIHSQRHENMASQNNAKLSNLVGQALSNIEPSSNKISNIKQNSLDAFTSEKSNLFSTQTLFHPPPFSQQRASTDVTDDASFNNANFVPDFLLSLVPPAKQNSQTSTNNENNNKRNLFELSNLDLQTPDALKQLSINIEDMINAQNKLCALVESVSDDVYEKCSNIVGDVEEFCKNSKRSSSIISDILRNKLN